MRVCERFLRWAARRGELDPYRKTPHVCFRIDRGSGAGPIKEFVAIFRRYLQTRYRHVWVWRPWLSPYKGAAHAKRGEELFLFNFWESARAPRTLILLIHPADIEERLITACREIHYLLTETPGVSRVWWYFRSPEFLRELPETQTVVVFTPDELSWTDRESEAKQLSMLEAELQTGVLKELRSEAEGKPSLYFSRKRQPVVGEREDQNPEISRLEWLEQQVVATRKRLGDESSGNTLRAVKTFVDSVELAASRGKHVELAEGAIAWLQRQVGAGRSTAQLDARHPPEIPMQRPPSVTAAAWVIIALAMEAIVSELSPVIRNMFLAQFGFSRIGPQLGTCIQGAVVVCGAFMLRGANWARIAFVVLTFVLLIGVASVWAQSPGLGLVAAYSAIKAAALFYVLLRPEANAYFEGPINTNVSPAAHDPPADV